MKAKLRNQRNTLYSSLILALIVSLFPAPTRAETAVQVWVQLYNGPGNRSDGAAAVAVDGNNNIIVTGGSTVGSYPNERYDYTTIQYSSAGVPLWTNHYNGPGNGDDNAVAVAVDGNNNVIVTGYSFNGTNDDYATIKYSSAGVPLWTNRYSGPGDNIDLASALAVDGSNNVIVTGTSGSGGFNYDYATIEYSSAGVPLWTNRYSGPGNGEGFPSAMAVDGSNNVIVTGYFYVSGSSYDYATIAYSSAGVPLWTNSYNGPGDGDDGAVAVTVDGSNNVIVTGYSTGSGGYADYATIKYSTAGVPLWTNSYNGPGDGDDGAVAVAVDGSNNVIVTGHSYSSSGTNYDYVTIQYSTAGVPLWTNRYNGPGNNDDFPSALAVDGSNNVIVTGYSTDSGGYADYETIKYSSTGVPLWTSRYTGPGNAYNFANAVVVDGSGNVIVTGNSWGGGSYYDFATVKYICVPSPVMIDLKGTNGTFQMRVDEVLQPGTLVIEASTDLADWAPVFTNTISTNVLFYADPKASDYNMRFYRAFQFP